jgi:hypothetical protein
MQRAIEAATTRFVRDGQTAPSEPALTARPTAVHSDADSVATTLFILAAAVKPSTVGLA